MEITRPANAKLRKEKMQQRLAIPDSLRRAAACKANQVLTGNDAWKHADILLIYVSYGAEFPTHALIRQAVLEGKKVYCPKVEGKKMSFYRIADFGDLQPGYRGILEPVKEEMKYPDAANAHENALLIAPGLVFDPDGNRIGYGGGYYDRWLSDFSEEERPYCIGICYACQLTEHIFSEKHDIAMDEVLAF